MKPFSAPLIRLLPLLLAAICLSPFGTAFAQDEPFIFEKNVMIPMRDGTQLAANIFLPKGAEKFPVILLRTPYGKGHENRKEFRTYASEGYVTVVQDCRGRGDSKGEWEPFRYDAEDGFDTQEWIGAQPWCNGSIGTTGNSYVGWTQWASAPNASKYLKAMSPTVPFSNAYDLAYIDGAFQWSALMNWGSKMGGAQLSGMKDQQAFRHLPLNDYDANLDHEVSYLEDWIEHPVFDDYWKQRGIGREAYDDITVPILNIGGWYDIFAKATLEMSNGVRHESRDRAARRNQFVVMGPWRHGIGRSMEGGLDFGEEAALNIAQIKRKWFDYWLKEKETGVQDWPAFQIFVMGENKWRGESEWPLARTQYTPFYLHSAGSANSLKGDGALSAIQPDDAEKSDTFVYDPSDPVPTAGGNILSGAPVGPHDQTQVEQRDDVLVYTSEPLKEGLEVTGPVKAIIYAATTAKDTDFTAKLVDVHPDGKAYNICDGIIRARWRNSRTERDWIEPGKTHRYEIDLWVTSNLFKPGHRIRVEISSSNFPRFNRNPNTGLPFGTSDELQPATQTIFHDAAHASHILLPVIPN